jgi:hypothetical protein
LVFGWLGYQAYTEGKKAMEETGGAFDTGVSRISLSFTLGAIQVACSADPSGEAAKQHVHPEAFDQVKGELCKVDDKVIEAFGNDQRSTAESLAKTDAASKAESLGLDPKSCYRYVSGGATLIGCSPPGGQFQIIHAENLDAVQ